MASNSTLGVEEKSSTISFNPLYIQSELWYNIDVINEGVGDAHEFSTKETDNEEDDEERNR